MIDEYVPKMANGEIFGAMALTEPNYGSDLPNLQTKAILLSNRIIVEDRKTQLMFV